MSFSELMDQWKRAPLDYFLPGDPYTEYFLRTLYAKSPDLEK